MGTQCKAACDQGYYKNVVDNTCRKCHINCASCTGPTQDECISCQLGSFLVYITTTCLYATCPAAYFGNFEQSMCDPYSKDCNKCIPFEGACHASSARNNVYLEYTTQTCMGECPDNNYGAGEGELGRRCRPCRNCMPTEWESQSCNTQHNRICNTCTPCDTSKNLVLTPCAHQFTDTGGRPITQCNLKDAICGEVCDAQLRCCLQAPFRV